MRRACDEARSEIGKQLKKDNSLPAHEGAMAQDIRFVAEIFVELQTDRHTSDYDSSKSWT